MYFWGMKQGLIKRFAYFILGVSAIVGVQMAIVATMASELLTPDGREALTWAGGLSLAGLCFSGAVLWWGHRHAVK